MRQQIFSNLAHAADYCVNPRRRNAAASNPTVGSSGSIVLSWVAEYSPSESGKGVVVIVGTLRPEFEGETRKEDLCWDLFVGVSGGVPVRAFLVAVSLRGLCFLSAFFEGVLKGLDLAERAWRRACFKTGESSIEPSSGSAPN